MKRVLSIFLALIAYLGMGFPHTQAHADEQISYTNVLEDLTKDKDFSIEDYPAIAEDYSLQVIQIAESVNGELFVYVYQPSDAVKELTATTIRMALPEIGINAQWQDYDLTLLSTEGVFDKYKVEGLTLKSTPVRYYDISAIHRKWEKDVDKPLDTNSGQYVDEVVYEVGQLWKAETVDDKVTYTVSKSEVIEVKAKVVGYIRYDNGFSLKADACDSHFVAFTTDKQIDMLQAARVGYKWRMYRDYQNSMGLGIEIGEWQQATAELIGEEVIQDGGWFGKYYTWNRIEKVEDFINENEEDLNLTSGKIVDLKGLSESSGNTSWVLRFFESDYEEKVVANLAYHDITSTEVSGVTIIQLTFQTNGECYNLGVVDNKQTGTKDPFASADTWLDDIKESKPNWQVLIAVLALCLLVPILYPLLSAIIEVLVWLITAPFKAIKGRKNDKDG